MLAQKPPITPHSLSNNKFNDHKTYYNHITIASLPLKFHYDNDFHDDYAVNHSKLPSTILSNSWQ